ncbi:MAG: DUF3021 family protein [Oscillospiraceae bacterium]
MSKLGHFFKSVICIKIAACISFTASLIIALLISFFLEHKTIELAMLWQLLIISLAGSIIQWFAFSEDVIKRLKYVYRNVIFIVPFFAVLSGAAYLWKWFDTTQLSYWVVFMGAFILAYIGLSIGFLIYFRLTGQKYNEKLEEYKASK